MTSVINNPSSAAIVDEAIASRRSIRAFLPTPVPREDIEAILATAARAPSGTNIQPWKVTVLTDGSLSSCPPAEAVTWGKVDKDTYQQATESMQADYSTVMPFVVKALLENRARFEREAEKIGEEALFEKEPRAKGYLRDLGGYRLFEQREEMCSRLKKDLLDNREWLEESLAYPLAVLGR